VKSGSNEISSKVGLTRLHFAKLVPIDLSRDGCDGIKCEMPDTRYKCNLYEFIEPLWGVNRLGRSLGCNELHRCKRPFRARPIDVIIIERQQRRSNWHGESATRARSRGGGRGGAEVGEVVIASSVIKAKEYKLRRLRALLNARIGSSTKHYGAAFSFSRKAFNELHSWYRPIPGSVSNSRSIYRA